MSVISSKKIRYIVLQNIPNGLNQRIITRDHEMALNDLKQDSLFHPFGDENGPYDIRLSVEENRLIFRIQNNNGEEIPTLILSLNPYKKLIKDYFIIVESYEQALKNAGPSKLEAIDVGRRCLHNEGAELLIERLEDKITMDSNTARRLFTLICVLYAQSARFWV
ncbi:MAG: UPF0262 family protein [Alphaproteobacteria bacterium]|nr:UPF0262 family protein [Alphaproteobacteria bacterium]